MSAKPKTSKSKSIRMPSLTTGAISPQLQMRMLESYRPAFRRRNIITALCVLGWVFGMYGFTIMAVKQEDFLDGDFEKRKLPNEQ